MASRSIICQSLRLSQIVDLRDTDKSRYFVITNFNNCFNIRLNSLFSYLSHSLTIQGSDLPFFAQERHKSVVTMTQNLFQNTFRRSYAIVIKTPYEYIRVTHGYIRVHKSDIRIHTSNMRVHTSDTRIHTST